VKREDVKREDVKRETWNVKSEMKLRNRRKEGEWGVSVTDP
jgi:hypothetical protein